MSATRDIITSWPAKLGPKLQTLVHEMAKFGAVGVVALIVDVGLFNLLLYLEASPLYDKPLSAKAVGVIAATTVAYFGNRFWTFRSRGSLPVGRGYLLFFALNAVAMLIAMSCLAISHYVLGLTGPLADNISANVVGLVLGTLFRFWSYRRWVFPQLPQESDRKAMMGTVEI
ncbi:GtrA family protein [Candidatus Nanopelagicales bacterium]|nr:GtrA family protein [Candidatus Nanopelagicales bacterium]